MQRNPPTAGTFNPFGLVEALLIPLASPTVLNILKTLEDSGYCYVPSEEPAKSLSVPGQLGGDPAGPCLLLLAPGQPSPAQPVGSPAMLVQWLGWV